VALPIHERRKADAVATTVRQLEAANEILRNTLGTFSVTEVAPLLGAILLTLAENERSPPN
jgi:hypothetical protein